MPAYANLKSFTNAVVKPYITALQVLYRGQVDFMLAHLKKQEASITSLQTQVVKLSDIVVSYEKDVVGYQKTLEDIQKNSYTQEQLEELIRRNRELEMICLELYQLVRLKLPDEELPDFDNPILPDDPLPTAADIEATWRETMGLDPEVELDDDQRSMLRDYIQSRYASWPRPPSYSTPSEPDTYWTDEELTTTWYTNNHLDDESTLTDEQQHDLQAYLDYYEYMIRNPRDLDFT